MLLLLCVILGAVLSFGRFAGTPAFHAARATLSLSPGELSAEELLKSSLGESQLQDDLQQIGLSLSEFQVPAGAQIVGRAIEEIDFGGSGRFLVVAVRGADGQVVQQPPAAYVVQSGDTLIVLGSDTVLPQLIRRATAAPRQLTYRGATSSAPR